MDAQTEPQPVRLAVLAVTGLALILYSSTAAPGLTWAHHSADGGELLAAAATNGVPHPSGYPLYMILLRGWLLAGQTLTAATPARLGTMLSVLCAALSAGFTVATAAALLAPRRDAWRWAALAGIAWVTAPLVWSQSIITEVYTLHTLLVAIIGWAAVMDRKGVLAVAMGLAAAHHITSLLLWPALFYALWTQPGATWGRAVRPFVLAAVIGGLVYLRTPWAAAGAPPVNWGYPDNVEGFLWLVSGEAYRGYLLGVPLADLPHRVAQWARLLVTQFTPVGFGLALVGIAGWDQQRPRLNLFGLLWIAGVSLYMMTYQTTDSHVYLLPVVWMAALWFANGLAVGVDWLQARGVNWAMPGLSAAVLAGLILTAAWRMPEISLRHDREAEDFLAAAAATFEPGSLVISNSDAETFALWYGAWAGDSRVDLSSLILVNKSLYNFEWYRRLLAELYPDVPEMGGPSFDALLTANAGGRPIFAAEPSLDLPGSHQPVGMFWRLDP